MILIPSSCLVTFYPRMKVLVLVDISLIQFYGYINIYKEMLMNILTQNIGGVKID